MIQINDVEAILVYGLAAWLERAEMQGSDNTLFGTSPEQRFFASHAIPCSPLSKRREREMPRSHVNGLFGALLVGILVMFPAASSADHVGQSLVADGMEVHLGIMAAQVLRQRPEQYPYHKLSNVPSGKNMYHVLLALFDRSNGERITDADVEARVAPLGLSGPKKRLEPMSVAGAITYCNYFKLSPTDMYVLRADIRRPELSRAIRAEFVLRPH